MILVSVTRNDAPFKYVQHAVMAIFPSYSRSRSTCPLINNLANSRYFQKGSFSPLARKAEQSGLFLFSLSVLSVLQIRAKLELFRSAVEQIERPVIHCGL